MTSALIFTRTKHGASKLTETLKHLGKSVAVIHGNRSQSQRQQALQGFISQAEESLTRLFKVLSASILPNSWHF
jgi:superfamily II DNA/RNA helicase